MIVILMFILPSDEITRPLKYHVTIGAGIPWYSHLYLTSSIPTCFSRSLKVEELLGGQKMLTGSTGGKII